MPKLVILLEAFGMGLLALVYLSTTDSIFYHLY
ncbi:DUF1418 family protein [Xenorhabdus nematophila]|nr:DUF1418 family protein [Xenorhabdus nematophila]